MAVYVVDSGGLAHDEVTRLAAALPSSRQDYARSARTEAVYTQRVVAAYVTYWALARPLAPGMILLPAGRLADGWERVEAVAQQVGWPVDAAGKPFAQGVVMPQGRRYVSLSHTGTLAVAAVATTPVGVDVERLVDPNTARRLLRKLPPVEAERLQALGGAALSRAFTQVWTAMESAGKLTGRGLRMSVPLGMQTGRRPDDSGPVKAQTYWLGDTVLTLMTAARAPATTAEN